MLEKQVKRNPALMALLGTSEEEPKAEKEKVVRAKKDARKLNPKGYERNRGKGGTKPMSYYLPDEVIKALALKAAKEGKTKSEVVLEGLHIVLKEELKDMKKVGVGA